MHREFKGLSEAEVVKSQEKYGKNIIIEKPPATLWERIKRGWDVEKSLTQPLRGQKELIWRDGKLVE